MAFNSVSSDPQRNMDSRLDAVLKSYPVPEAFIEKEEPKPIISSRRKLVGCIAPGHAAGIVMFAMLLWCASDVMRARFVSVARWS